MCFRNRNWPEKGRIGERWPGYWPDIEKSRAEARRLLKEAGAEGISFELLNRDVDQPYKYIGSWLIDQWSKIGLKVTQRVVPSGPWYEALRSGNYDVAVEAPGHGIVNPLLDVQKELPESASAESYGGYEDPKAVEIYDRMLRETDPDKQKALMLEFETHNLDTEAHQGFLVWWNRIVPYHAYVKGWKIGPSHLANQDLATVGSTDEVTHARAAEDAVSLQYYPHEDLELKSALHPGTSEFGRGRLCCGRDHRPDAGDGPGQFRGRWRRHRDARRARPDRRV